MRYLAFPRGSLVAAVLSALALAWLAGACTPGPVADADAGSAVDAGSRDGARDDPGDGGPAPHRVLFVGNSYTAANGLSAMYRTVAAARLGADVETRAHTPGGRRLSAHAVDAASDGHVLHTAMQGPLDVVVLQEQSQIPGFPAGDQTRAESVVGAVALAGQAAEAGALVVLFATWGRRDGDAHNPELFPDFLTMQDALDRGYLAMRDAIAAAGHTVRIAPVGRAFRIVWQDIAAAGGDPTTDPDFTGLYVADGSHPSLEGSYLALHVILQTVLGAPTTDDTWVPDGLAPARAAALRAVAARAVMAP